MSRSKLGDELLEFIRTRRGVSCVELADGFGSGNATILEESNIVIAFGLSEEVAAALNELIESDDVVCIPCSTFVYLIDGRMPDLPIAKANKSYKKPHWQPVAFDTFENALPRIKRMCKRQEAEKIIENLQARKAARCSSTSV